jgi:hypothetical protein
MAEAEEDMVEAEEEGAEGDMAEAVARDLLAANP